MCKIHVLIVDGEDSRVLKVVRALCSTGRYIIHALTTVKRQRIVLSRCCKVYTIDKKVFSHHRKTEKIIEIAKSLRIDVFLAVGEWGLQYLINNQLYLNKIANIPPLPTLESLRKVSDKWLLHQYCTSNGFHSPRTKLFGYPDGWDFEYPFLLKPRIGAGGYKIQRIENRSAAASAISATRRERPSGRFICQQQIDGDEVDFSGLCIDGKVIAYTIQEPVDKPADTLCYWKTIRFIQNDSLLQLAGSLLGSLGWEGVVHIDFITERKSKRVFILDFNPRFWGTLNGSTSAGVNFAHLLCLAALGEQCDTASYAQIVYSENMGGRFSLPFILLGKGDNKITSWKHTAYRYSIMDPLPEITKVKRRLFKVVSQLL